MTPDDKIPEFTRCRAGQHAPIVLQSDRLFDIVNAAVGAAPDADLPAEPLQGLYQEKIRRRAHECGKGVHSQPLALSFRPPKRRGVVKVRRGPHQASPGGAG